MARRKSNSAAPTMVDVARLADVSPQTVSRVLNDYEFIKQDTRDRVWRAVDSLDYRPNVAARTLVTRRSRTIGVVATDYMSFGPANVVWAVEKAARDAGYSVSVVSLGESTFSAIRGALERLVSQSVDGIVMIAPQDASTHAAFESFNHVPVVTMGSVDSDGPRPVMLDSVEGSRTATTHLIDLGHRDIAHLGGDDDEGLNRRVPEDRRSGFLAAMRAASVPVPDDRLLSGHFSLPASRDVMNEFFARPGPRPTAVFASSDEMAIGTILAAGDSGLNVPRDVSVIGIDNHDLAESFGLTTMAQDPYEHGERGARILLDELANGPKARATSLRAKAELLVRNSTARPPH